MEGEELPENFRRRGGSFAETAQAEGLEVGERTHRYNSTPAHEAAFWADEQGKGDELRKAIYQAYFRDNTNIGSIDVLADLATGLGLDGAELRQVLEDRRYRGKVLEQFQQAHEVGVTAVPTFVAAGYALVGAHPLENFRKLMEAAGEQPKAMA
jgi:predicted DsbA family dithiol-disulfide isomerase